MLRLKAVWFDTQPPAGSTSPSCSSVALLPSHGDGANGVTGASLSKTSLSVIKPVASKVT